MVADLIDRIVDACARRPRHARLPLRRLRGHRAQAADRPLRRPRGGARPAAARRAVRRPLSRRPAVDADQQGVVLDQEGRGVLRARRTTATSPTRMCSVARVRAVARRPRPRALRRDRVATTRTTSTPPASCTTGWSSSAPSWRRCTARSRARRSPEVSRADAAVATPRPPSWRWPSGCTRAGHELLGDLVQWHRREARPAWWEVFRLQRPGRRGARSRTRTALGGLSGAGRDRRRRSAASCTSTRSRRRTRSSRPASDGARRRHRKSASAPSSSSTPSAGRLVLKSDQACRRRSRGPRPGGPARRQGPARGDPGDGGRRPRRPRRASGRRCSTRRGPAGTRRLREGETPATPSSGSGCALHGEVLAVQGPPGQRQDDRAASRLIRELLDAGKKVGVTATSHAVIGNVLRAVGPAGAAEVRGEPALRRARRRVVERTPRDVAQRLLDGDVAWSAGRRGSGAAPDLAEAVDVLVIDEAGQFSLANAVAVARAREVAGAARRPAAAGAAEPGGAPGGVGALGAGAPARRPRRPIPRTAASSSTAPTGCTRTLTAFVSDLAYEGRLESAPGRERIAVLAAGPLSGSGLRVRPCDTPCRRRTEPAGGRRRRARCGGRCRASTWRTTRASESRIGAGRRAGRRAVQRPGRADQAALPDGARVGTVDKFQGQEAPVVIYSMTQHQRRRRAPRRLVPLRPATG